LGFPAKLPYRAIKDYHRTSASTYQHTTRGTTRGTRKSRTMTSQSRNMTSQGDKTTSGENTRKEKFQKKLQQKTFWIVLTHKTFLLFCMTAAASLGLTQGFLSFGPKYAESALGKSPSEAAQLFGVIGVPGAAIGLLSGAVMMGSGRFSSKGAIKMCFLVQLVTVIPHFALLLDCGDRDFAGYNSTVMMRSANARIFPPSEANWRCQQDCDCSPYIFYPVCGSDEFTYFSPCYAGCTHYVQNGSNSAVFTNCSCFLDGVATLPPNIKVEKDLKNNSMQGNYTVDGKCGSNDFCRHQPVLLVAMFFIIYGLFFSLIPGIHLSLSLFDLKQRSVAFGVQWILNRLLGTIPGPSIFGYLFDKSCRISHGNCPNEQPTCVYWNNSSLSSYLFYVPLIFKSVSICGLLILCFVYEDRISGSTPPSISSVISREIVFTNISDDDESYLEDAYLEDANDANSLEDDTPPNNSPSKESKIEYK